MTHEFHTHKSSYNGKLRWKERSKTGYGRDSHEQSLQVRFDSDSTRYKISWPPFMNSLNLSDKEDICILQ